MSIRCLTDEEIEKIKLREYALEVLEYTVEKGITRISCQRLLTLGLTWNIGSSQEGGFYFSPTQDGFRFVELLNNKRKAERKAEAKKLKDFRL